ncbi:MAG TPA: DUF4337 domain-containing protein [Candidatus Acidoferrum sp.]|nr:DUF4337 domain-containing protein [Candidatus Acidoferrum sp.]
MPEGIELPETEHERGDNPFLVPVSVTISTLAVLVAGVTLMSHRAHTEELLRQSQAANRWAQYQAKSVRQHTTEKSAEIVSIVAPLNKEIGEAVEKKNEAELEHYKADKEDITKDAKDLEADRDLAGRKADRFDGGEALLEVGLVICSLTLLTKKRLFWIGGMVIAAAGLGFALTGFLLH